VVYKHYRKITILDSIQAIGHPTRFEILHLVRDREMAAGEIAQCFDQTRPAISVHLRILLHAGLLSERRAGTKRLYTVRPEGFAPLHEFLAGFWDVRLQGLKRAAEAVEGTRVKKRRKKSR
jgi:DNA-binding transcriptional ArsR family regulator